jgi:hypothetical protein
MAKQLYVLVSVCDGLDEPGNPNFIYTIHGVSDNIKKLKKKSQQMHKNWCADNENEGDEPNEDMYKKIEWTNQISVDSMYPSIKGYIDDAEQMYYSIEPINNYDK